MAVYIRADKRKNKTYYWLVESHREGDKVVQRRIKSLGTEPPTGKRSEEIRKIVEDFEKKLNAIKKPPTKEPIKTSEGGSKKMNKTLTFKVHREKELVDPRWREVEPENADCPLCRNKMAVMFGTKRLLYAYCGKCQKYFLGE